MQNFFFLNWFQINNFLFLFYYNYIFLDFGIKTGHVIHPLIIPPNKSACKSTTG